MYSYQTLPSFSTFSFSDSSFDAAIKSVRYYLPEAAPKSRLHLLRFQLRVADRSGDFGIKLGDPKEFRVEVE